MTIGFVYDRMFRYMIAEVYAAFTRTRETLHRIDPGTIMPEVYARLMRRGWTTERLLPVTTHIVRSTLGAGSKGEFVQNLTLMTLTGYAGFGLAFYEAPRTGLILGREIRDVVRDRLAFGASN